MDARTRVRIAVTTYNRVERLEGLIQNLRVRIDEAGAGVDVDILIVDNDPGGSAAAVLTDESLGELIYINEREPGIAAARQRALREAGDAEVLIYLDDDLLPEPGWLSPLISTWREFDVDAVMGFVRYVWPEGTSPWIAAGGFMRRNRFPTGTELDFMATGNVLLDMERMRLRGMAFDRSLGLAGGEDTLFGKHLLEKGGRIVFCGESVARDNIPAERTTRAFVRRRAISHGQARVRTMLADEHGATMHYRRVGATLGALARLPFFGVWHLFGRLTGNVRADADGMRRVWFSIGRLTAAALGRYEPEYVRPVRSTE